MSIEDIYKEFDKMTENMSIEDKLNLINDYENKLILSSQNRVKTLKSTNIYDAVIEMIEGVRK